MKVFDADAHITEGIHTWDFLEPHEEKFRPLAVTADSGPGPDKEFWIVDGHAHRRIAYDPRIPAGIRELTDVRARLARLDEMGIDVQVIYPTFFGVPGTYSSEIHIALCKSYNRFLAEAWSQSNGRLPWILVPPIVDIAETLSEMERFKSRGACGVYLRGIEGNRRLSDPFFDPVYQKAQELDLPVCIHIGIGNLDLWKLLRPDSFLMARTPVLAAFNDLYLAGVPKRFPKLRVGFIEAGAQWVPFMVSEIARGRMKGIEVERPSEGWDEKRLVPDSRYYINCRMRDDLKYIMQWTTENNLIVGTDYGHNDTATELDAFERLRRNGSLDRSVLDGMLWGNAITFYGLAA